MGFLILNSGWGIEWPGGSFIPYKELFNRGFEVLMHFKYEDNDYRLRMIILFDHGLFARKQKTLQSRIHKTQKAFEQIAGKLNHYKLKSYDAIDKTCSAILKNNHTKALFNYRIINEPITTNTNIYLIQVNR